MPSDIVNIVSASDLSRRPHSPKQFLIDKPIRATSYYNEDIKIKRQYVTLGRPGLILLLITQLISEIRVNY
jgi:hypothetical protein